MIFIDFGNLTTNNNGTSGGSNGPWRFIMSEFRVNSITNQDGSAGPQVCGVSTFSGKSGVQIPSGPTDFRRQDGGGRGRGVFGSGATPSGVNVMDLITIATTGNSTDFGDDFKVREENYASFSSSTRGINAGGYSPAAFTDIGYFTFASQGGMNDFGDLITAVYSNAGTSNQIRGLSFGGSTGSVKINSIEFVTIASTGQANNFGSLTERVSNTGSGVSNGIRAFQMSGNSTEVGDDSKKIHVVTIATTGDAVKFGELITARNAHAGCSNSTRGLVFCGQESPGGGNLNSIEFFELASEGNAVDFGDASATKDYLAALASSTRGVCGGGQTPTKINVIEHVTIASTGDAVDFGDLTVARRFTQGCSDVHGGLAQ